LNQDLAQTFFAHVKAQATGLMSDEHFTVDGMLIEAWAGRKSFRRKDDDEAGGVEASAPSARQGSPRPEPTQGIPAVTPAVV
jgi:hypothetical protein